MRGQAVLAALSVALLPAAADAGAEWREMPISDVRVISDGSGHVRLLVNPGSLLALQGKFVEAAVLTLPMDGQILTRELDVRVFPITRSWESGVVTWTTPWSRAGGDVDERRMCAERLADGERPTTLRLNISGIVREMVDGSIDCHGFLLGVARHQGAGFRPEELARFGGLQGLALRVKVWEGRSQARGH
ncbi:MAG: hypothetical protein U0167_18030 [bacterium]